MNSKKRTDDEFLVGFINSDEEEEWFEDPPQPTTFVPMSLNERAKEARLQQKHTKQYMDFTGDFDQVDHETLEEAQMPSIPTVDELCRQIKYNYPPCPDIDALFEQLREATISSWPREGHKKSIRERMKKQLEDRCWKCSTCNQIMKITDCRCGRSIDKHFGHESIPCVGFDPALQSEHGSLVCVSCMLNVPNRTMIVEYKELVHSLPKWLLFLRCLLLNVFKKSTLSGTLETWKSEINTHYKKMAPAIQTLLEYDSMALGDQDLFEQNAHLPEYQDKMYQRYRFDGVYRNCAWSALWTPALSLLDECKPWKETYFSMCKLSGQLGIALALWVRASTQFNPDPARREFLKPGETIAPTDPWTSNYCRYSAPFDKLLPTLDRVLYFWQALTIRGPGKCLASLTIGMNELLYNQLKGHVTIVQQRRRAVEQGLEAPKEKKRVYHQKRKKADRGRDSATGSLVRVDVPDTERFDSLCESVRTMITVVKQVPMEGVVAEGAFHFLNHFQQTCNSNRATYSAKYKEPKLKKDKPRVINDCYGSFISFVWILKLFGIPLHPPLYPSKEEMMREHGTKWKIPSVVWETVCVVPGLKNRLGTIMRYIYAGLSLHTVEKASDLISDEIRTVLNRLQTYQQARVSNTCGTVQQYEFLLEQKHTLLQTKQRQIQQNIECIQAIIQAQFRSIKLTETMFDARIEDLMLQKKTAIQLIEDQHKKLTQQLEAYQTTHDRLATGVSQTKSLHDSLYTIPARNTLIQKMVGKEGTLYLHPQPKENRKKEDTVTISKSRLQDLEFIAEEAKKMSNL